MNCKNCNKPLENTKRRFCSDKCRKKYFYNNTIVEKSCIVCNKKFKGSINSKCCCEKCNLKAQRKYKKICPICKKSFKSRGNGIYCGESCYKLANNKKKFVTKECLVCNRTFKTSIISNEETCNSKCAANLFSHIINLELSKIFGTYNRKEIFKIVERKIKCQKEVEKISI
ncbi:hypothetical protein C0L75_03065 [Clostridium perfringens]